LNKLTYIFLFFLIFQTAESSLNAQSKKKKKSNPKLDYRYQDLTSRNNYYFNARLILQESIKTLIESNQDDYSVILDVYEYSGGEQASAVHSDLEVLLEKATNDLKKHPNSKWIDNEYVVIGQAYYLKGDYEQADESFDIVNDNFSNKIRKGKRSSGKKKKKSSSSKSKSKSSSKSKSRSSSSKTSSVDKRAKEIAKLKAKKEKVKKAKARKKEAAKRNKNRAKLKKINAKRKKKKKPRLSYEDVFGKSPSKTDDKVKKEEKIEEPKETKEEEVVKKDKEDAAAEPEVQDAPKENVFEDATNRKFAKEGIFTHKSSTIDAFIWQARNHIDNEQFGDAITILNQLKDDKDLPKKKVGELYTLLAHYYLKKEEYSTAHSALTQAIEHTKRKKNRARLHFIQAQISEHNKDYSAAQESYNRTLKSKPPYLLEFNSRLKQAINRVRTGESREKVNNSLEKMLKEDKNSDYQDQIYFAMAEMALADGEVDEAISLLEKSAEENKENPTQRANTYLQLAELLFDNEQYPKSGTYYDSALTSLAKDYKGIEELEFKRDYLLELGGHIARVEEQDSLQHLASLSEAERNKIIDKYIKDFEAKVQETLNRQSEQADRTNDNSEQSTASNNASWYFYNDKQKSQGFNEFQARLGSRVLEDNWRRSSRLSSFQLENLSSSAGEDGAQIVELAKANKLSREMFVKRLPLTQDAIDASNDQIIESLFAIGNIYKEQIGNIDKAKEAFASLVNRFPGNEHEEQTLYTLYLLSKEDGQDQEAQNYANLLAAKYKNGTYNNLIQDPSYAQKQNQEDAAQTAFYEDTYFLYLEEKFQEVLNRKIEAEQLYASTNAYGPQFDLLEAYVIGHTGEKDDYIKALKNVMSKHPEDPVKEKAEEILKYLEGSGLSKKDEEKIYQYRDTKNIVHYFIVSIDEFSPEVNKLMADFSNFNRSINQNRLKTTPMLLTPKDQIVLVKNFLNADKAMEYYRKVDADKDTLFKKLGGVEYSFFVVSKTNFTTFFKNKDLDSYMEYFEAEYLE